MENHLLERIDKLIAKYRSDHKGETPLYIIVSPDENKKIMETVRATEGMGNDQIVTSYKDIKLAEHPQQVDGKIYVSNELPETGS
jgi:hypothetical protein